MFGTGLEPVEETLLLSAGTLLGLVSLLWCISLVRRDASVIDAFWGTGFVIVAWMAWWLNAPASWRVRILVALTTVWGLRLSIHLLRRNLRHGEDRRYRAMRVYHGPRFWWVSLFTVFLLQGGILWFVSFPIQFAAAHNSDSELGWLDAFGIILWSIGLFFEAVGDWQLARFQSEPMNAGRVLDRGLWRVTRHPNYFGDFCVWWGLYVIATAGGAGWTFVSPLLMSFLLMKVSGVTLLESTITDRRPGYAKYKARTNAFFPGRPRVE